MFFVALQIGKEKLYLFFLAILDMGMRMYRILVMTSFAGVGMELEFIGSSY